MLFLRKSRRSSVQRHFGGATHLIRFIVSQTAADVGVAPGEGLAPGGGDQNFVFLHSEDAFVSAHDLSHGLLQL